MDQSMPDSIRGRKMLLLYGGGEHCLDCRFVVEKIRVIVNYAFPLTVLQPEPAAGQTEPFHRPFGNQLISLLILDLLDKI
jgi:hypothetical protein